MAGIYGIIKGVQAVATLVGVPELIKLGTAIAEKGLEAGITGQARKDAEKRSMVEVPEIHSADYHLKLEDAKRWLEEDGLRAEPVLARPNINFRGCVDGEVVASNYKAKQRVKPGTRIIVKYVTTEVIEESQRMYDEIQQKKQAQKDKNKQRVNDMVAGVQQGINDMAQGTKKKIDRLGIKRDRKQAAQDAEADDGDSGAL